SSTPPLVGKLRVRACHHAIQRYLLDMLIYRSGRRNKLL
ncbi:hypothetical protein C6341_g20152, partial [Phytophthora cactorum]